MLDVRACGGIVWRGIVHERAPGAWVAAIRKEVSTQGNPAVYIEDVWPPKRMPVVLPDSEAAKRRVEEVLRGWVVSLAVGLFDVVFTWDDEIEFNRMDGVAAVGPFSVRMVLWHDLGDATWSAEVNGAYLLDDDGLCRYWEDRIDARKAAEMHVRSLLWAHG
jgi:hypothetical protein